MTRTGFRLVMVARSSSSSTSSSSTASAHTMASITRPAWRPLAAPAWCARTSMLSGFSQRATLLKGHVETARPSHRLAGCILSEQQLQWQQRRNADGHCNVSHRASAACLFAQQQMLGAPPAASSTRASRSSSSLASSSSANRARALQRCLLSLLHLHPALALQRCRCPSAHEKRPAPDRTARAAWR